MVAWPLIRPFLRRCCGALPGLCFHCYGFFFVDPPVLSPIKYEDAISGRPRVLKGVPTYRLPHHPRYAHVFMGRLYKAIMARAVGKARFTRLTSGRGLDEFHVSPHILVEADLAELVRRQPTAKLSEVVQRMTMRRGDAVGGVPLEMRCVIAWPVQLTLVLALVLREHELWVLV